MGDNAEMKILEIRQETYHLILLFVKFYFMRSGCRHVDDRNYHRKPHLCLYLREPIWATQ